MSEKAIIYARVSTDDTKNSGGNLQGQIDICLKFCKDKGYEVVEQVSESETGASGASLDLPGLERILDLAHNHRFNVLVVRELDRLSRNTTKTYLLEQELKSCGVRAEFALYDFPDSAEGRLQKNIYASFAEFEREKIAQRVMRGRIRKTKEGYMAFGGAPYGYRWERINGGATFAINEQESLIVKRIFELYVRFENCEKVARTLQEEGIAAPKSDYWWGDTIKKILSNEVYTGCHHVMGYAVSVPAIIEKEVFNVVQGKLKKRAIRSDTKHPERFLTRHVFCGNCGGLATVRYSGKPYYLCGQRTHIRKDTEGRCPQSTCFNADNVDRIAWGWLAQVLTKKDFLQKIIDYRNQNKEKDIELLRKRIAMIESKLKVNQHNLSNILVTFQDASDIEKPLLQNERIRLNSLIAGLQSSLAETNGEFEKLVGEKRNLDNLLDLADKLDYVFNNTDFPIELKRRWANAVDLKVYLIATEGKKQFINIECALGLSQTLEVVGEVPIEALENLLKEYEIYSTSNRERIKLSAILEIS